MQNIIKITQNTPILHKNMTKYHNFCYKMAQNCIKIT